MCLLDGGGEENVFWQFQAKIVDHIQSIERAVSGISLPAYQGDQEAAAT